MGERARRMSRFSLIILIVHLLSSRAGGEAKLGPALGTELKKDKDDRSNEELREFAVDELIKNLDTSINAREAVSDEFLEDEVQGDSRNAEEPRAEQQPQQQQQQQQQQQRKSTFWDKAGGGEGSGQNSRDRKSVNGKRSGQDQDLQADIAAVLEDLETRQRPVKKKTQDNYQDIDELIKEAYGLPNDRSFDATASRRNQVGDHESEEQYQRSLFQLLNLYRLSSKRYQDEQQQQDDDRLRLQLLDRHLGKKLERGADRSRFLADRIAEAALLLGQRKGKILEQSQRQDETAKRDVEVASSTSAASSTSVDASVGGGGATLGAVTTGQLNTAGVVSGGGASAAGAVNVAGSTSVVAGGGVADATLGISTGTSLSAGLGARAHVGGLGLLGQLNSCHGLERKMILDMAIQEATAMIRKLAYETRSEVVCKNDPDFERRILGLAIELVNKLVILGPGGELDLIAGYGYNGIDDYLKAPTYDAELEAGLLTNAGFDYLRHRDLLDSRRLYDDLDLYDEYYPRGRCDSCSKYDLRLGNVCPVCKRSSPRQKLPSRLKRSPNGNSDSPGKIYHLEKARHSQHKEDGGGSGGGGGGGVWEDLNKLYDFRDLVSDKFIDLSTNCTGTSANANPDCQRLRLKLVAPPGIEPVELGRIRDYLILGRDLGQDMNERARSLLLSEGPRPSAHTASMLQFINSRTDSLLIRLNDESQLMLFGTKVLQEKLRSEYNMTPSAFLDFLGQHGFRVTGSQTCRPRRKRCNSLARFRTIEGSCNNFDNPSWGQSGTAFVRILPARYSDGIHALALSVSGKDLPNPRALSSRLFPRRKVADSLYTLALMQWGQILAHDFARQVMDQTVGGGIECCAEAGARPLPRTLQHHSCLPILIPEDDPFYGPYGQSCMNFVRSMTVVREDCSLGPAHQLNGVSSFLDLSPVYGADRGTSDTLREFRGGRMRIEIRSDRIMMPTLSRSGYCDARTTSDICFETGDARTNQNPQLIILQTLLIREHNRIANELEALNPHWTDERLFQEARRILIAEYQHITYNEWLPLVVGEAYCRERVSPLQEGLSDDYDSRINPGTINGFTSGAFRFLHSIIEGNINLIPDSYGTFSSIRLSDFYFRPQIVENNSNFEALLRGLVYQTIQKPDGNFHEEVTEYLFRSGHEYGMDLEALDIQRGRDHGLPGYNAYRELCELPRAEDFKALVNEIPLGKIQLLESMYEHVDDIDLIVGATMESRVPGSMLGPTLQCLIGEQFYRSRVGDKYFYNNANFPHSFTLEQFAEIRKASLATVMCELGEAMYEIQGNPFKLTTRSNPKVPCFELPKMNLEHWKDKGTTSC